MRNRFVGLCAIVFAGLLLAGCVPSFVNPLSDVRTAKIDTRLIGTWISPSTKEKGYLHILPGENGMSDGIAVSFNNKNGGDWTRYSMFSTRIGKHWFLNIKDQDKSGKDPVGKNVPYFIVRYRIVENNRLDLWLMSQDSAETAIANGLKGEIKKSKFGKSVRITASSAELMQYVKRVDPTKLFEESLGTLQRQ